MFLYTPGLLMIALSPWSPRSARVVAAVAAVPFAADALIRFAGGAIDSTAHSPVPATRS